MENKTALQAQMLANRLQKRFRHLKKWAKRTGIEAFRLYDRDIPEIPLVLDYYGNCDKPEAAAVGVSAVSGALYKRPYEKDAYEEEQWLLAMKESAAKVLNIRPDHFFIKQRERQRGTNQYEKITMESFTKTINENGLLFKVNLSDYLDTGLFLDRRLLRAMIRNEASGKNILNLFSYTGSFSVYAANGGAVSTCSVDLSNTYLNWAKENFLLNGMSVTMVRQEDFFMRKNDTKNANNLIRADALDFLHRASAAKMRWDIIIVDPPAFSNSKKMTGTFDIKRDITELLGKCLLLLNPGGKLFLSVNVHRSAPKQAELEAALRGRFIQQPFNIHIANLDKQITDEDFRGRNMPASFLIETLFS